MICWDSGQRTAKPCTPVQFWSWLAVTRSGSGARGLAGRRPSRCNASMKTEFDLAEFGRLLSSGRREDLKKIAQVMSQPDRARLRSGR
jgi:hypothetical protein